MTASIGETTLRSSMKSPRWLSSSSPIGVSREIGSCAIFMILRTFETGMSIRLAISSAVGSRPELLDEGALRPGELVDRLDHVDRDADRPGLVGDGAGDRLADPPGGVGRELVAAAVLELLDRLHEADVPLLDQVEELEAAVRVLLGDGDDEAEVRDDELLLGPVGLVLPLPDLAERPLDLLVRDSYFSSSSLRSTRYFSTRRL